MLAQLEESNLSQMKEADELRSNIRELEAARQEARRDNQQLQNQVYNIVFSLYFIKTDILIIVISTDRESFQRGM